MDIENLRNNLFTQDNRATANPVYVVFEWKKYHADPRYTDTWEYGDHSDGYNKIGNPGDRDKLIEFAKDNNLELPQDWVRIDEDELFDYLQDQYKHLDKFYYHEIREFVTACFTEEGAENYIKCDGHNLRQPHIYVMSLNRNDEMLSILRILKNKSFDDANREESR